MRKGRVLLLILTISLATACAGKTVPNSTASLTGAGTQSLVTLTADSTAALAYPTQLVSLNLTDAAGRTLDLKEKALGKPAILIFWASW